ncbi:class I SAM-dependent methyltransferase, partial [Streptomyces flavofungini]|uniref:class I SAM-dependent methyltransferase n=1 Tax=Streptomyces flavofungini TaxID=68200 RepID=UPI0034DF477A
LYARLAVGDEPEVVAGAVPPGAHILELGSGAGRVTRPLLERGFRVTAVDESAEMLEKAAARGGAVRTVCGTIEGLDLDERFPVVLLASFLVHTGDESVRRGILRACRRHVTDGGCVLIQRQAADYHTDIPRERVEPGGHTIRIASSEPVGGGVHEVRAEYVFPDAVWTQTFRSRPLTREQFEQALLEAGLKADSYLTDDGTWVRAVPML